MKERESLTEVFINRIREDGHLVCSISLIAVAVGGLIILREKINGFMIDLMNSTKSSIEKQFNNIDETEVEEDNTVVVDEDELTVEDVLTEEPVETEEIVEVQPQEPINTVGVGEITGIVCAGIIAILGLMTMLKVSFDREGEKEEKAAEKAAEEEAKAAEEEKSAFKKYQDDFQDNIIEIKSNSLGIKDSEIKNCIRQTLSTIDRLYENIDETEFDKGNLASVNDKYLQSYGKVIKSYRELSEILEHNKTFMSYRDRYEKKQLKNTVAELRGTIINFNTIFSDLLMESVDKDALDASLECSYINNYATRNGIGNSSMLLKNTRV